MGFERWGMRGAQPSFLDRERGMIIPARDLLKFEVGDPAVTGYNAAQADESVYRYDIRGIDNIDARLLEEAPMLADLAERSLVVLRMVSDAFPPMKGDSGELTNLIEELRATLARIEGD